MKQSFALLLFLFQAVTIAAQTTNRFPINRGLLQSDLDGNGLVITNVHISGSVTGLVSAASGSVISNSSLFGGLSFANGAYFGIDQQQVFGGGGPNGGGIRIVDGDLGGEVSIEGDQLRPFLRRRIGAD